MRFHILNSLYNSFITNVISYISSIYIIKQSFIHCCVCSITQSRWKFNSTLIFVIALFVVCISLFVCVNSVTLLTIQRVKAVNTLPHFNDFNSLIFVFNNYYSTPTHAPLKRQLDNKSIVNIQIALT